MLVDGLAVVATVRGFAVVDATVVDPMVVLVISVSVEVVAISLETVVSGAVVVVTSTEARLDAKGLDVVGSTLDLLLDLPRIS